MVRAVERQKSWRRGKNKENKSTPAHIRANTTLRVDLREDLQTHSVGLYGISNGLGKMLRFKTR